MEAKKYNIMVNTYVVWLLKHCVWYGKEKTLRHACEYSWVLCLVHVANYSWHLYGDYFHEAVTTFTCVVFKLLSWGSTYVCETMHTVC